LAEKERRKVKVESIPRRMPPNTNYIVLAVLA